MPKMIAVAALAMGAMFCAAELAPVSAQVMKNFSWKKKPAKAKQHEAAAETGTGQAPRAPRRQKAKSGN
jgi:hypothetical protein